MHIIFINLIFYLVVLQSASHMKKNIKPHLVSSQSKQQNQQVTEVWHKDRRKKGYALVNK